MFLTSEKWLRFNNARNRSLLGLFSLFLLAAIATSPVRAQPSKSYRSTEPKSSQNPRHHMSSGDLFWNRGEIERAFFAWEREASVYRSQNQKSFEIKTLLKISQAHISLGQFSLALERLKRVLALAPANSRSRALAHERLGNAYSGIGDSEKAIASYTSSLEIETSLSTLNNLVEVFKNQRKQALLLAQEARQPRDAHKYRQRAKDLEVRALRFARRALRLSQTTTSSSAVRTLIEWNELSEQKLNSRQLSRGQIILRNLAPSRSVGFLMLNWAELDGDNKAQWLYRASNMAKIIGDPNLGSYSLLALARLKEESKDLDLALKYAAQAQLEAQSAFTNDSLFRAQRLAGRIYQKKGQKSKAIDAYRSALSSIAVVGRELNSENSQQIAEFNREIEPYYREALELLLARPQVTSADLSEVLSVFERLKLAQLQSYFGENCFEVTRQNLSSQNVLEEKNAVLINSIILKERVVFLLQLPDGRIIKSETEIAEAKLVALASQWHQELKTGNTWRFRTLSHYFYDRIVRPFEAELRAADIQVLVFIHDGILRNLPMAALSDGQQFLAQKWASVSSIGLNFTSTSVGEEDLKALAFGLQVAVPGWSRLKNVEREISSVQNIIGGDIFLNDEFTLDSLTRQLNREEYSVVHLASHGYFGGTAETSFILAYDRQISAVKLEEILWQSRQPIELLVLSACETAIASERSLLGLAGVAAKSGVSSVVGSLWAVQDESQAEVVEAFYSHLSDAPNKAIALQQVQVEQIRALAHPQKWAALNLIGDW